MANRYIYSRHSTEALAYRVLEDFYARGEVSEGEQPRVEKRGFWWCITLIESA